MSGNELKYITTKAYDEAALGDLDRCIVKLCHSTVENIGSFAQTHKCTANHHQTHALRHQALDREIDNDVVMEERLLVQNSAGDDLSIPGA